MYQYVADFETTTNENDCRVWAWAICEIGNLDNVYIGTNIHDFMSWCEECIDNVKIYFHNLKFDGQFLLYWLFDNGFKHVQSKDRATKTFTTIISDKGLYYSIEVIFWMKGKKIKKVTFWDSLKVIPISVSKIAETFKLPYKKLKIDYDAHNDKPFDYPLTPEEKAYIINDVKIVAHALHFFQSQGLNKMTIGSCALNEYKTLVDEKNFKNWFPVPKYHNDVKQSYKGGFTYLEEEFAGKNLKDLIVLDVNSMFSYVMKEKLLPYGTPVFFKGQYQEDKLYPLYTQMIKCQFELKPGKIPTIQIKDSMNFSAHKYLTSSEDEEIILVLNSVDLEQFLEHYDIYNLEYLSGWKFKATTGLFDAYIDKWVAIKKKAKEEENGGLYLISKQYLNSLYGKFGTGVTKKEKRPYMSKDGVICFKDSEPVARDGVYIAMASFITSYSRHIIIENSQRIKDNYAAGKSNIQYVYSDTDSLHILSPDGELPEWIEIDDTKLGAFKLENVVKRAKYIRSKCYINKVIISEKEYKEGMESDEKKLYSKDKNGFYKMKITVAGMPADCYDQVTFSNFKIGAEYKGKKQPVIVKGGVVLKEIDFTIKE